MTTRTAPTSADAPDVPPRTRGRRPLGSNDTARPRTAPSPETTRLYASDWNGFLAWCRPRGLSAFPASPETVAAFLNAQGGLSHGALARRLAAIADQHRRFGHPSPCADSRVKAIMRAARRASVPRRSPPPGPGSLARMASGCAGDLAGLRDRALLLLASQTGLGRADLVGLDAECVRFTSAGVELVIRDRFGGGGDETSGRKMTLKREAVAGACPMRSLEAWMRASDCQFGPVFRKVDRWGNVEHRRLCTDAVRRICINRRSRPGKGAQVDAS